MENKMTSNIEQIQEAVKRELSCSAHDLSHVYRVHKNCMMIADSMEEEIDREVLEMAAYLHDIARVKEDQDSTGAIDHALVGGEMARELLEELQVPKHKVDSVCEAIKTHRFRGEIGPQSLEAKILFDGDKLDVVGAIGIARSFILAGEYGQPIYKDMDLEEYKKSNIMAGDEKGRIKDMSKHASNLEFHLKQKYIHEKLFTSAAKEIGKKRVEYMSLFFQELSMEMEGKS